ncbi:MAG: hypothetical protein ABJ275_07440 [Maricaulaceae bacterium]
MSVDPRIIAEIFDDLRHAILRWTSDLNSLEESAINTSLQSINAVADMEVKGKQVERLASEAWSASQLTIESVKIAETENQLAREEAGESLANSQTAKSNSDEAVSIWVSGLERANQLHHKAKNWLSRAQGQLNAAINQLSNAEAALSSANSSLSACQSSYTTDSRGNRITPNCSAQASRVSQAQGNVNQARQLVRLARTEVDQAEAEVQRCQILVSTCNTGLDEAHNIRYEAENNVTLAYKSVENAKRAQAGINDANSLASSALIEGEKLVEIAKSVLSLTADMQQKVQVLPNGARRISELTDLQRDLEIRGRTLLKELDENLARFNKSNQAL